MIISVPEAAAVYAELEERAILGDFRPGAGIRASARTSSRPTMSSDSSSREIAEIAETGAWERHAGAAALH